MNSQPELKTKVAGTIKWNLLDRLSTQVLYAVTGIVLARLLSHQAFGLVGAILVFQAFASMFVDSGFSWALIQRKSPTEADYSTVLWFNLGMAGCLYAILFFAAPWIATLFGGDMQLVPLARVMFLSFIINAASIVQVNRLMKQMDVRWVTLANSAGLIAGAIVGIYLAVAGWGAWAIVWQTMALAVVKTAILWGCTRWLPRLSFSWAILKSYFRVGSGVMVSSFLNVLFLNIFAFFIGNRAGLVPLGYYTQADKWSKMGYASISQTLNASFGPSLSCVQDDPKAFASQVSKMNRFVAYVTLPAMVFLAVMGPQIFHVLFGTKWDGAIVLFQILLIRGIFINFAAQYNNYILALGHSKTLVWTEAVRDGFSLLIVVVTLPWIALQTPSHVTAGLEIFLLAQLGVSFLAWVMTLWVAARRSAISPWSFIRDMAPYLVETIVAAAAMWALTFICSLPIPLLIAQGCLGLALYLLFNFLLKSKIQQDVFNYLRGRKL